MSESTISLLQLFKLFPDEASAIANGADGNKRAFWDNAADKALTPENDRTLAFAQRCLFIQTGDCPALLS